MKHRLKIGKRYQIGKTYSEVGYHGHRVKVKDFMEKAYGVGHWVQVINETNGQAMQLGDEHIIDLDKEKFWGPLAINFVVGLISAAIGAGLTAYFTKFFGC